MLIFFKSLAHCWPIAAGILIAYINEWVYLVALIGFIVLHKAISLPDIEWSRDQAKKFKGFASGFVYVWKTKIVLGTMTIDIVAMLFKQCYGYVTHICY
ncbi:MAG: hypothetical protein CM15mP111_0680 [Hyphomicrobiales bacterium]|nr:MAG: hypothetical protein CM15mP111_0680 [Hyphomicrobiales bacterium]